jgi:tetratricopeptide (TPR) repeat protein
VLAEMQNYPAAIADYDHAIALDRNLAEAYYNRGLVYIKTNHIEKGVADLSKAGEMGLYSAYSLIKKYNIEMKKKQN